MGKVLGIVYRTLATHLIHKAGYKKSDAHTGAVTLIQRFGGALNLNIHFHMIFLDGVYLDRGGKLDRFRWVKEPTTEELSQLTHTIATRDNFVSLLQWLPPNYKLQFYDQYYPSMSDPGAYVTVFRKDNLFIYKLGNHGWSGEWSRQSVELLASWLFLNLEKKDGGSDNLSLIDIRKVEKTPWDRIS